MNFLQDLAIAYRVLAQHNIIDAYGHVSQRCPTNPERFWMARSIAPELVTQADMLELNLDSEPVDPQGRSAVNERFIHGEIYKTRPDVMAVVHNHSPSVIPFCCTQTALRPIFHLAAFIGQGVPNWEIREAREGSDLLVRDTYLGASLAQKLGAHPAALMRGHGAVVVGESLQIAVGRSVYLEQNARLQWQAQLLAGQGGAITFLDDAEVATSMSGWQDYGRFWNLVRSKVLVQMAAEQGGVMPRPNSP